MKEPPLCGSFLCYTICHSAVKDTNNLRRMYVGNVKVTISSKANQQFSPLLSLSCILKKQHKA